MTIEVEPASRNLIETNPVETGPVLDLPVELRVLNEEHKTSVRLARVDRGFLKVFSPVALPKDTRVEVTFDGCSITAAVVSCEQEAPNRFALGLRRTYGPQGAIRAEPRVPVDLSAVPTFGSEDRMFARIIDMSQSGLGFELPTAIPLGTRVAVQFVAGIVFGEIRHCAEKAGLFRAGMRIEEFIVRPGSALVTAPSSESPRAYPAAQGKVTATRLSMLAKRAFCFAMGHEYAWSTDLWGRALLRCSRCQKILMS